MHARMVGDSAGCELSLTLHKLPCWANKGAHGSQICEETGLNKNIPVMDVSQTAIDVTKKRLGLHSE